MFIDLQKAFDMVEHEIPIRKLELYEINGKWLHTYLENRKQYYVNIDGQNPILIFFSWVYILARHSNLPKFMVFFQLFINQLISGMSFSVSKFWPQSCQFPKFLNLKASSLTLTSLLQTFFYLFTVDKISSPLSRWPSLWLVIGY